VLAHPVGLLLIYGRNYLTVDATVSRKFVISLNFFGALSKCVSAVLPLILTYPNGTVVISRAWTKKYSVRR
jgi:hypothetical protein